MVLVMFLENVFPPIPSELVVRRAGFLVEQGSMHFVVALVASTLGSVLGAAVLYEAGRHGGRPLVLRYAKVQCLRTYGIVMPLMTTGPSV